ncbi:Uncharacterised protein [Vibrio cholerae]|uniref:Uncharacterized protein n=1 Tax=Vibrio cholerae TaxID=666 RepID=A0A655RZ04_VIBCL|nr:Uncharacterised protein [Vibrio cholerae]CRZ78177.1 Uncharacterised protein [Vibrio cholerae]CSB08486.1 Uncharacterised protein [Vibrio cholerae]CSB25850.1 Uncharacterised protein [Vibrio cholerae]CSB49744.1 Uncharacterised protein [Vibrio cholerae]
MPPIEATIGISTAKATTCEMTFSNKPMVMEARMAVRRLMPSHKPRFFELLMTGANRSSPSSIPVPAIRRASYISRCTLSAKCQSISPIKVSSSLSTGTIGKVVCSRASTASDKVCLALSVTSSSIRKFLS